MKRIVIEITEEQHAKMMEHIQKEAQLNLDNETLSGYSIHLNCIFPGLSLFRTKNE